MVFVVLKVMCFYGVDWIVMIFIYVKLVTLGMLKCRKPSLSLAAYDIGIHRLVVSLQM